MLKIKKLCENSYEMIGDNQDYHIRLEDGVWVVDTFDSTIANKNKAYITTENFESLQAAIEGVVHQEGGGVTND